MSFFFTFLGSMKRELSTKLGKDFRNWENDGQIDYQIEANEASQSGEFEWERVIWS